MATIMGSLVVINFSLLPPVVASPGLGELAVVCEEGTSPPVGGVTSATDVDGIAALLTANVINADGADQGTAALSQGFRVPIIYFGTHTAAENVSNALDNLVVGEIDFGTVVVADNSDAGISAAGTWLSTGDRGLRYLAFVETLSADMLTASKPGTLTAAELNNVRMLYGSSAAQGLAGAAGGTFAGKGLASGPATARPQISGQPLPGITDAEQGFADGNDAGVLRPFDVGASASQRGIWGTTTYSGVSFTAETSLLFTVRRMRAALNALVERKAILNDPLLANAVGVGEVTGAIDASLALLADVGHYNPGTSTVGPDTVTLAKGYRVTGRVDGANIVADVLVRLNQEVRLVTINGIGEVV